MARAKQVDEWGMHPGLPHLAEQVAMLLSYAELRPLGPAEILSEVRDLKRTLDAIERSVWCAAGHPREKRGRRKRKEAN